MLGSILTALGKPSPATAGSKSAAATRSRFPTSISTPPTAMSKQGGQGDRGRRQRHGRHHGRRLQRNAAAAWCSASGVNLQVIDADLDLTDGADTLKAVVEVYREKTQEEIDGRGRPRRGAAPGQAGPEQARPLQEDRPGRRHPDRSQDRPPVRATPAADPKEAPKRRQEAGNEADRQEQAGEKPTNQEKPPNARARSQATR